MALIPLRIFCPACKRTSEINFNNNRAVEKPQIVWLKCKTKGCQMKFEVEYILKIDILSIRDKE